ncbi:MAG: hypothetical protein AAF600_10035 [Bacteroidota bacterium]
MKKYHLYLLIISAISFSSCNNDDENEVAPEAEISFALLVQTDVTTNTGFILVSDSMFTGTIDPLSFGSATIVAEADRPGIAFGNRIYQLAASDGTQGIQEYTVLSNGSIQIGSFISADGMDEMTILNETTGYYKAIGNQMRIQTFNPSIMQRTGEIDLRSFPEVTMIEDALEEDFSLGFGNSILAADGRLFVQFQVNDDNGGGFPTIRNLDYDILYMAIIDPASDELIDIAQIDGYSNLNGFPAASLHNISAEGDMYFTGIYDVTIFSGGGLETRTVRILSGANDFDDSFDINMNDIHVYGSNGQGGPVLNGKIYYQLKDKELVFGSNQGDPDNFPYVVNTDGSGLTKISGIPGSMVPFFGSGPVEIDGLIYYSVISDTFTGYYSYNPTTGDVNEAFRVDGATPIKLMKLIQPIEN